MFSDVNFDVTDYCLSFVSSHAVVFEVFPIKDICSMSS